MLAVVTRRDRLQLLHIATNNNTTDMVQTIAISENTTLKYLREKFNLQRTQDSQFFPEWCEELPEITDSEKVFLDRIVQRYFYQLDEASLGLGTGGKANNFLTRFGNYSSFGIYARQSRSRQNYFWNFDKW